MNQLSRRDFLKLLQRGAVALGLGAVAGPIIAYFYPPELEEVPAEPVRAGALSEFPVGASKTIRFGRYPALIVHTDAGLRAYSAVCTHFACIVKWDTERGEIACPCHDGFFAAEDGRVLSGPPPLPLEPLAVAVVNGEVYVGGEA